MLMSPVKFTSISLDEGGSQVKEGFLSLESIEIWIVYACHSEGECAGQKSRVHLNIRKVFLMFCALSVSLHFANGSMLVPCKNKSNQSLSRAPNTTVDLTVKCLLTGSYQ